MAPQQAVTEEFDTARRLLDLVERDGVGLESAVSAVDDEGRGRLHIVPFEQSERTLQQTLRVAETIVDHRDELPSRHDLRDTMKPDHPIVQVVRSVSSPDGRLRGAYSHGADVDGAYILRPAA
jgi:hypothetical protein